MSVRHTSAVLLAAGAAAGGLTVAVSASAAPEACTPGTKTVAGVRVRVYCGPARARVVAGGVTYRFAEGRCRRSGLYEVTIGAESRSLTKGPVSTFFGLSMPPLGDGTYTAGEAVLGWTTPGLVFFLARGKVTVAAGGRRGSFSGTVNVSGRTEPRRIRATGAWTC